MPTSPVSPTSSGQGSPPEEFVPTQDGRIYDVLNAALEALAGLSPTTRVRVLPQFVAALLDGQRHLSPPRTPPEGQGSSGGGVRTVGGRGGPVGPQFPTNNPPTREVLPTRAAGEPQTTQWPQQRRAFGQAPEDHAPPLRQRVPGPNGRNVPPVAQRAISPPEGPVVPPPAEPAQLYRLVMFTAHPGDTLTSIAPHYGVTAEFFSRLNGNRWTVEENIGERQILLPLWLYHPSPRETLTDIAERFSLLTDHHRNQLIRYNRLVDNPNPRPPLHNRIWIPYVEEHRSRYLFPEGYLLPGQLPPPAAAPVLRPTE